MRVDGHSMNEGTGASRARKLLLAAGAFLVVFNLTIALLFGWFGKGTGAEEFHRLTNLGKGYYDRGEATNAVEAFQKALKLAPANDDAQINLACAELLANHTEAALRLAEGIAANDRNNAGAWFVAGCASLRTGQATNAIQALQTTKNLDVTVNAVSFQLGLAYEAAGRATEAINEWTELAQFEPDHPAVHYRLGQVLMRSGKKDEALVELEAHRRIAAKNPPGAANPATYERCKYTAIRLPFETEQPDKIGLRVVFADATDTLIPTASQWRGPLGVIDFGQNGQNHLLVTEGIEGEIRNPKAEIRRKSEGRNPKPGGADPAVREEGVPPAPLSPTVSPGPGDADHAGSNTTLRLLFNSNGVFHAGPQAISGRAGNNFTRFLVADLNNDGVPEALALGEKGVHLLKFTTNGAVTDATAFAGLKNATAIEGALLDLDFRGNLDLLAIQPGTRGLRSLRNLGNMYFTAATTNSGLPDTLSGARSIGVEDWNGDDLLDVIVGRESGPPLLFLKQRGGALLLTNSPLDWPEGRVVALGDLNNDLRPDLVIATADHLEVIGNGLKSHVRIPLTGFKAEQLYLFDYDNDGWLDILVMGDGLRLFRNEGQAGFRDVSHATGLDILPPSRVSDVALADFDNDGDTDLMIATEQGLRFLRNDGGNANLQLKLLLAGKRSNASGLGVRLEVAAGGLRLARRVSALPVEIGVGRHAQLDSLGVRWFNLAPSLVEVKVDPRVPLPLIELSLQEGSCPYLYAWDGNRFRFVTDILGAAPLGLPVAEGRYVEADPEELVWLGNETNFKTRGQQYVLQITEELREVLYLDQARLVVADHPFGTEVHSTSKLRPGRPFPPPELVVLCHRRVLRQAVRADGTDVTALLAENDGQVASPPRVRPQHLRGLAEPHSLTLDFGPLETEHPLVLALTGWLRLGGGMANIAASQDPGLPFPFPTLEVESADGQWRKVDVTVGAPSGKTKTILVELAGRLPRGAKRLRLNVTSEIHWDRMALFDKAASRELGGDRQTLRGVFPLTPALSLKEIPPTSAPLHWRGFSELADLPWYCPWTPMYEQVKPNSLFTIAPGGWCTRYGEVDELVRSNDNALALINAGDELTLTFAATDLPPLAPGHTRDFFLFSSGWDKDSDFHVATGTSVTPLPWHGLDDQWYGRQARPAFTNDAWMERFNTRWCGARLVSRRQ